ncbi:glutathione S-transferase N-terminal domain-containing protein [Pectobacteriaceae bacterium CE70]|uniref:Glutathione S-transferase n=1 Tax=Serratia sp. (strain ATCC 39006) TaxID=104623 RepID=A0A2I5TH39_SERS3|nr:MULTISPECIES: glutathione S-transferase N-terminal domain-containing protein [Enterobacterales]WJV61860.1 glutathione S-transferase N-terminal domain-containing protein [Pectobacteriaceae bacterium C52]WJV66131.1 glutathione S-transferase N-terminal domain-containing protein [Pectobacteriaceae bacterium CE70]WJY10144.1 glutathione S-transferase N-terminal domain-containing protein [Pectobacteriaceae bacterium C80]AUG99564.1 glutathione S-transferase [Serratia sp. ATCC 39006]AUH03882.1 gluta
MLKFYFHPTPNPMKVALFLEESGLPYELIPVDTLKGEQHLPAFRQINPNGKLPAIDDNGTVVFDSNAILLYLAEKTTSFLGQPEDRGALLSWLMFIATGLGPFSGQSVHFQRMAPEPIPYAINRYRREAERHYAILDAHLKNREFMVGNSYTIVDMAAWGWIDRVAMVLDDKALQRFPNLARWFKHIDSRPAVGRARAVGKDVQFKSERDEVALRALFPQNFTH